MGLYYASTKGLLKRLRLNFARNKVWVSQTCRQATFNLNLFTTVYKRYDRRLVMRTYTYVCLKQLVSRWFLSNQWAPVNSLKSIRRGCRVTVRMCVHIENIHVSVMYANMFSLIEADIAYLLNLMLMIFLDGIQTSFNLIRLDLKSLTNSYLAVSE